MIELTDEMVRAFRDAWAEHVYDEGHQFEPGGVADRAGLTAVLTIADRDLRSAIADEIKQSLAADEADSDVTSGEAIWEQSGYRNGLEAAAEIARGEP